MRCQCVEQQCRQACLSVVAYCSQIRYRDRADKTSPPHPTPLLPHTTDCASFIQPTPATLPHQPHWLQHEEEPRSSNMVDDHEVGSLSPSVGSPPLTTILFPGLDQLQAQADGAGPALREGCGCPVPVPSTSGTPPASSPAARSSSSAPPAQALQHHPSSSTPLLLHCLSAGTSALLDIVVVVGASQPHPTLYASHTSLTPST